jgi:hypothetical protein
VAVVRELLARFGIDFDSSALNKGVGAVEGFASQIQRLGGLIASSAIVAGTYEIAASVADFADELTDTGAAFGFTAEQLLTFRTAAAAAGVEAEGLNATLGAFSRNVAAAATNADARRKFEGLGVSLRDAAGNARAAPDVLRDTLVALNGIADPTQRAALAMQLLGEKGARLLPAFADGGAGLEALQGQVDSLFGDSLGEAAARADELEAAQARWTLATQATKTAIGLELLPIVNWLIETGGELASEFGKLTRGTTVFKQGLVLLGTAATVAAVKTLLPFLPVIGTALLAAAAIGVVVLIVDDLIALFTGGRSVIGEFIDSIFGVGTAAAAVRTTTTGFREIGEEWRGIFAGNGEIARSFSDAWEMAVEAVSGYFDDLANDLGIIWDEIVATIMGPVDTVTNAIGEIRDEWRDIGRTLGVVSTPSRPNAAARNPAAPTPTAPRAGAAGGVQVRQTTTVGQIVVQGASDPEATAEAVQARIREGTTRDLEAARQAVAGRPS